MEFLLKPHVASLVEPAGAFASVEVGKEGMDALVHHCFALVVSVRPLLVGIGTETGEGVVACPHAGIVAAIGRGGTLITTFLRLGGVVVGKSRAEDVDHGLEAVAGAEVGRPANVLIDVLKVLVELLHHVLGSLHRLLLTAHLGIEVVAPEDRPPLAHILIGFLTVLLLDVVNLLRHRDVAILVVEVVTQLWHLARPVPSGAQRVALHIDVDVAVLILDASRLTFSLVEEVAVVVACIILRCLLRQHHLSILIATDGLGTRGALGVVALHRVGALVGKGDGDFVAFHHLDVVLWQPFAIVATHHWLERIGVNLVSTVGNFGCSLRCRKSQCGTSEEETCE